MKLTRIIAARHTWAAMALAAAGLLAVGSPGVANAYPGPGGQRDQDEPAHGYADAIGGQAEPTNWGGNWLFGNGIPRGNYGLVASPSAGLDDTYPVGAMQVQPSMPIVMPAGQPAPAPTAAAPGGQTAATQGGQQPMIPAPAAIPIIPAGATS